MGRGEDGKLEWLGKGEGEWEREEEEEGRGGGGGGRGGGRCVCVRGRVSDSAVRAHMRTTNL